MELETSIHTQYILFIKRSWRIRLILLASIIWGNPISSPLTLSLTRHPLQHNYHSKHFIYLYIYILTHVLRDTFVTNWYYHILTLPLLTTALLYHTIPCLLNNTYDMIWYTQYLLQLLPLAFLSFRLVFKLIQNLFITNSHVIWGHEN